MGGHIKGGLAHTTVVSVFIWAGVSGWANADASAIGAIMLPSLKKGGYDDGFAVSVVAAAAGLGPIIPPSIIMIIYASATGFPVGKLFLSGVIPGLCLGIGYMVLSYIYAVRKNMRPSKFAGLREIWNSFKVAIWALIMPLIIVGGILSGAFTATEAGVIAVVYGFAYGILVKKLNVEIVKKCLLNAVIASTAPMLIIAVSGLFGNMLVRENVTSLVLNFCNTYISSYFGFYVFIIIICLIAGCFIDAAATMLMLIPVLMPVVVAMNLDPLHFAIVFIIALLTAGLTPPVGVLLFVVCSIDNTPLNLCVRPIIPFVSVMLIVLLLLVCFPWLGTWLPSLLD